ncbi:MAG: bacteriohemerythrin [Atribacterota bacterium]
MPLLWNDSLLTGVSVVDNQHRELFRKINELLDSAGKGREKVREIATFLQNYITTHFETEEKLMVRAHYPDYENHKHSHDQYSQEFKALQEEIDREGASLSLTVKMNNLLIDWWINHINRVDKKMAEFIRDKI